jgi:hypothetical protein
MAVSLRRREFLVPEPNVAYNGAEGRGRNQLAIRPGCPIRQS